MSTRIGFAVVEFNQASGRPSLVEGSFTDDHSDAERQARQLDELSRSHQRGERHYPVLVMMQDQDFEEARS